MKRMSKTTTEDQRYDKKLVKNDILPSKETGVKNSILVDLYENKNIATVYHLFLVILLSLFTNQLIYNYIYNGEIKLGFNLLIRGFSNFHTTIAIWLGMFAASFICYYGFKMWAHILIRLPQNSSKAKLWNKFMIGLLIVYYSLFLYFPPYFITQNEIPILGSTTLMCDSIRMIMVFHSFVRSNATRVLRYKKEDESAIVPSLSSFLYFYFAPTLIYKDDYPRSESRNWKIIFGCVIEFFGVILLMSFLFKIAFIHQFENYGLKPYPAKEILLIFLNNTIFGLILCCSLFYIVLHVWLNMFAELMKFSDRTFYKDWWTSLNYERYYRTWNVVVHEWLFTYIYKDFYENVYSKSKTPAKLLVFVVSTVFHEYALGFTFRFCVPITSLLFLMIGIPIMSWKIKPSYIANVILLYMLGLGFGIILGIHTMEYYSRINCPIENITVTDYFIPRLFSCNK